MKLLLVIYSLWTVVWAEEPSLSCSYDIIGEMYRCHLTINNPDGFNDFTEIGGTHLAGFTNADVNYIQSQSGNSTANIPRIICETFPNIRTFIFNNLGMTEVDDSAFSGCSRIVQLYLNFNRISSISANAFVNLPEVLTIDLGSNLLTTLAENLFTNQERLASLDLGRNLFDEFPTALFRSIPNLNILNWSGNRIDLSADLFVGLKGLMGLYLRDTGINEIPPAAFAGLTSLQHLYLNGNNFTKLPADSFPHQLLVLDLSSNRLVEIDDNAFRGLGDLLTLHLSDCGIRELNAKLFNGLTNLVTLRLHFNEIENIPERTFASMPNLWEVALSNNRLMTLRRSSFGTLTALQWLYLDGNIVNALDRAIIDDAVNLETISVSRNLCANSFFGDFPSNRAQYLPMLESCFRNMGYIDDTTTENDGVYSFFEAPPPGIVVRVQSDNEIRIALAHLNFLWNPVIEISIGATNNTRSVIRLNQDTDVVSVPTPNILQQNQWNDFRVTWADQNVLVFSGNEAFPFMNYTIRNFFPVNFFGLRALESRATWSVQPLQ